MTRETQRINKIREEITGLLIYWGVAEDDINIESNHSENFKKDTINAKKNGIAFRIIVYAQYRTVEGRLDFYWDINFYFFVKNTYDISLTIELENMEHKIKKLFGKRGLEVFEKKFDKTFWVEGNHAFAHVSLLDKKIQTKLLANKSNFTKFSLAKDHIRYKESLFTFHWKIPINRIMDFLEIGVGLAQNLENWTPSNA